jgi:hypothetical protein
MGSVAGPSCNGWPFVCALKGFVGTPFLARPLALPFLTGPPGKGPDPLVVPLRNAPLAAPLVEPLANAPLVEPLVAPLG